jgi:hypothetical protein
MSYLLGPIHPNLLMTQALFGENPDGSPRHRTLPFGGIAEHFMI